MKTVQILENGRWVNYATVGVKHVDLYVRYAESRGYATRVTG